MDLVNRAVTLYAGGTPLGVLDNELYAFLIPPFRADEWIVTAVPQHGENAVVIETADRSAGLLLTSEETGTHVAVTPLIVGLSEPPHFPPNEVWILTALPEEDAPDLAANAEAFTLRSQSVGEDQFIGRNQIEDMSMRPKPILLRPEGAGSTPFLAVLVPGEGDSRPQA